MKISDVYNKINLLQTNSEKSVEPNKQIKDILSQLNDNPVQVDISAEAMEQYKKTIPRSAPKEEEEEYKVLNDKPTHRRELLTRIKEINAGKGKLTVKEQVDSMLEAYASLYAEIVKGYEDGTRVAYEDILAYRPLTKEEDLAKLDETFIEEAKEFEELYYMNQKNERFLEQAMRSTPWGATSSRAQEFLRELDEKRKNPEYVPSNISQHIMRAGQSFLSKVSALNSINQQSVKELLSSISVW